jgi:hypothetical protein
MITCRLFRLISPSSLALGLSILLVSALAPRAPAAETGVFALGSHRELFVDDVLVAQRQGVEFLLHQPIARETVLTFDAPWEGSGSDFERMLRVGDVIRLYYMATVLTDAKGLKIVDENAAVYACMAESFDGIHFVKPDLGLVAYHGSKHNNIIWTAPKLDNFTPFRDTNPNCPPDELYKAMTYGPVALYGVKSPDGVHWTRISERPLMTEGKFDTQNNAFWDPLHQQYWCYIRGFHEKDGTDTTSSNHGTTGIRDIRVATSKDFRTWTKPVRLEYPGSPDEALYTNQVEPYYRAPQLFVGFPTRYVDRPFGPAAMAALPDPVHRRNRMKSVPRYGTVVTDGQFMTSRDGYRFHRWDDTFIPPGPERNNNWIYGDGYQSLGLIETPAADPTAPPELSCYADEGHWKPDGTVRRYTMRVDGFVSLHAKQAGGEFTTPVLTFAGSKLTLNFATTAAGSIHVEVLDPEGHAIPGFGLAECDDLFGDTLNRTVTWQNRRDMSALAGRPVRLHFTLREADLYSLKFQD